MWVMMEKLIGKSLGRGKWCLVSKCFNKEKISDATFFLLPKEKSRRNLWLLNCRRDDLLNVAWQSSYRICSDHFEDGSFKDPFHKKLMPNAVPTKFFNSTAVSSPPDYVEHCMPINSSQDVLVSSAISVGPKSTTTLPSSGFNRREQHGTAAAHPCERMKSV